jgi:DnaJ-class molecular chaperone
MNEPTVEVKLEPCPTCGGAGKMPARVATAGMSRSVESGGICEQCKGRGKLVRDVPLKDLPDLMQHPDSFR